MFGWGSFLGVVATTLILKIMKQSIFFQILIKSQLRRDSRILKTELFVGCSKDRLQVRGNTFSAIFLSGGQKVGRKLTGMTPNELKQLIYRGLISNLIYFDRTIEKDGEREFDINVTRE